MKLVEYIVGWQADIAAIRRDIHAHPELAYEENRTADVIAGQLQAWGIETHRGLGTPCDVGIVQGKSPNGPAVGLRAAISSLPMYDRNTFANLSQIGRESLWGRA